MYLQCKLQCLSLVKWFSLVAKAATKICFNNRLPKQMFSQYLNCNTWFCTMNLKKIQEVLFKFVSNHRMCTFKPSGKQLFVIVHCKMICSGQKINFLLQNTSQSNQITCTCQDLTWVINASKIVICMTQIQWFQVLKFNNAALLHKGLTFKYVHDPGVHG